MRGITFNGQHSYRDMGLTIAQRNIGNPSKIKNKERVPFSNTEYDFSDIYGGQEYTERPIMYVFNIIGWNGNKDSFVSKKIEVLNWLMGVNGKSELKDDTIKGYYFLGEVEDAPGLEEHNSDGTLEFTFTAYPFKIAELEEGHDIWDEFNFLLDYAQVTEHVIQGSKDISLYNNGQSAIRPVIKASAPFEMKVGNVTYKIPQGISDSYDLMLIGLETHLQIIGNGTISFHFHKEMI